MTLLRWTSRLRWRSSCHHHHFSIIIFLLTSGFTSVLINASSSSLHQRQYDANTLHLLHRDYMYEETNVGGHGSMKEPEDEDESLSAVRTEVLKRETAGVNMLKSSKDALIVTKKSYLKKDWCKTELLIQRIKEPGCVTRTIVNRFCYGQCNSFYIPKDTTKMGAEENAFKSCSFCKPKRSRWITISLNCPNLTPPFRRKRIQRVKKCKCISEILQS